MSVRDRTATCCSLVINDDDDNDIARYVETQIFSPDAVYSTQCMYCIGYIVVVIYHTKLSIL